METLSKGYKKFEGTDIVENAFNAINDNAVKTNTLEGTVEGKASSAHGHAIADITGLQTAIDGKEPTLATERKRKITISANNPSGGEDGDIWIKV